MAATLHLIFPVLFSLCGAAIVPVDISYTASVGDDVQLTWSYDDENEMFSVDWTFQSENSNSPESIMTQDSGSPATAENNYNVEHGGNGKITLKSVTMESSGKYFCAVSYNLGSGLSPVTGTATLTVNAPTPEYKCAGIENSKVVDSTAKCICVWCGIGTCVYIPIGFLIGLVLGFILKLSVQHWTLISNPNRFYCHLNMSVVLHFDISAYINPRNKITYNIVLNDFEVIALVRYENGVFTPAQVKHGYSVTADAAGNVELTIQNMEDNKKGIYSISGGGSPKEYACLYILGPCCCEDCVNNYYCECRCCASTPCGACCYIMGLPYWYQVLWASVLGIPVAFGIWVVLKCCNNGKGDKASNVVNTGSHPNEKKKQGRPQPPPPGANHRQLPDIHDRKGRGLSANYTDDDHPLVSINIPTKKPGALESIPDSAREEVTKKKKKKKKRVETEDDQSD